MDPVKDTTVILQLITLGWVPERTSGLSKISKRTQSVETGFKGRIATNTAIFTHKCT